MQTAQCRPHPQNASRSLRHCISRQSIFRIHFGNRLQRTGNATPDCVPWMQFREMRAKRPPSPGETRCCHWPAQHPAECFRVCTVHLDKAASVWVWKSVSRHTPSTAALPLRPQIAFQTSTGSPKSHSAICPFGPLDCYQRAEVFKLMFCPKMVGERSSRQWCLRLRDPRT